MGGNGTAYNSTMVSEWASMGLRFSRIDMYPSPDTSTTTKAQLVAANYMGDTSASDAEVLANNAAGINTLIMLGYTPLFNASLSGNSHSKPVDETVWTGYVNAVVSRYSVAPYNVKYFQIWNEASGAQYTSAQASFWQGPADPGNNVYDNALQDYMNTIHIPAAQIIRSYGAYVVYGGWPDSAPIQYSSSQGSYVQWLETPSTVYGTTLLDWTDYLDTHYYNVSDMQYLYNRYWGTGKIKGVWQSEIGYTDMENTNYVAQFYFQMAAWALQSNWSDPNQYVAMIYSSSGAQSFMPINQSTNALNTSGQSLVTLHSVLSGALSAFTNAVTYSSGASGTAIYNNQQIVFQITAPEGLATIDVNVTSPTTYQIQYINAVNGSNISGSIKSSSWSGNHLSVQLNVPAGADDLSGTYQNFMGYVVVTPVNVILGTIDGVSGDNVSGWACTQGDNASSVIQVFVGGPVGVGTSINFYTANSPSEPAVAAACHASGSAYRYSIPLGSLMAQYGGERIFIYSLSPTGATSNLLINSGNFTVPMPASAPIVTTPAAPVYRFFSPVTGEHFFTSVYSEGIGAGYSYEGVGFDVVEIPVAGEVPIFRCYAGTKHFVSTSWNCEGTRMEGRYGYVYQNGGAGLTALYRFYDYANGDHLETTVYSEGVNAGLHLEGILGYVPPI